MMIKYQMKIYNIYYRKFSMQGYCYSWPYGHDNNDWSILAFSSSRIVVL